MIAITEVRAAVLADKPWTRLDELVRREMGIGRKVQEIFTELGAMVDVVDETPGITADGNDAFLDTLDALVGNCRSDQCYYDPPSSTPASTGVPTTPATPSPTPHPA